MTLKEIPAIQTETTDLDPSSGEAIWRQIERADADEVRISLEDWRKLLPVVGGATIILQDLHGFYIVINFRNGPTVVRPIDGEIHANKVVTLK